MSSILNFFMNNYLWFLIICLILLFALIGYFVDTKPDKRFLQKNEVDKELEAKLAIAGASNLTLNEMMSNQAANVESVIAKDIDIETLETDTAASLDNNQNSSK